MVIVMQTKATSAQINKVVNKVKKLGYTPHVITGITRTIIGAVGDEREKARLQSLEALPGVENVVPILKAYKLASRNFKSEQSIISVGGQYSPRVEIGGKKVVVMAGPCSVENRKQILEVAREVKKSGAKILRGGTFKPRTSPYSFQGLEEKGLKLLAEAREETGLPIVTEVMNPREIELIANYSDILQVGARNIQNFSLLKGLGKIHKPILLKRGMMTTIQEFLMSTEYILSGGNHQVVLCERGIRTFEKATRNTLDLSCIPVLKRETHLPIVVDPSHATGYWYYVAPMSRAAIAAGADGLLIEVHPHPELALSDGGQSLNPDHFAKLMQELEPLIKLMGRE